MSLRSYIGILMLAMCSQASAAAQPARSERAPAKPACYGNDYKSFFDAFVHSAEIRSKYTAPEVRATTEDGRGKTLEGGRQTAVAYDGSFPIVMVDYYYKPRSPVRPGDANEYLILDINQGQNEAFAVEWTRVRYDGKSEGGDDLGNPFRLNGKPFDRAGLPDGTLLFEPHDDCWRLISDTRFRTGHDGSK